MIYEKMNLLCRLGLHWYRGIGHGESIHRYMQCSRCGHRMVKKASIVYQPLRNEWLNGGKWDDVSLTLPPTRTNVRPKLD